MNQVNFKDAYVKWSDISVVFGNKFYERKIDLSKGYPETTSLARGGVEIAQVGKTACDCSFFGMNMPGDYETIYSMEV